ncbi:ATPase [Pullulanibacillus camelliae]|uniref:histidine kinase n=1 Tax=Pullulanibacillus camelliae TaxID=1707096 RepID=A0A8J2VKE1_9BACL|nr:HAMP domain-containing sensor histidine kinase [Pullulanibacillus camelliae]GGE29011.1 ATPase [Pullulanibacillus camelliae]
MVKPLNILYGMSGLALLGLAMTLPFFTREMVLLLFARVTQSIETADSGTLVLSVFFYVLHQLVMCTFIYLGALFLSLAIVKQQASSLFQGFFAFIVIEAIFVENVIHTEQYSYTIHLLILSCAFILFNSVSNDKFRLFPLISVLILIILSLEWLNLIPSLSSLGFGSDDLATSIKVADGYLTNNKLLNSISTLFFILFSVLTLFFTLLIYTFNKQIHTLNKYQEQERELKDARIAVLESRVFKEVHTLVHDLKTPLVSIEGLTSLIEMVLPHHEKMKAYSNRIQGSVQKMKEMIAEILREDVRTQVQVKELFDYATSHTVLSHPLIAFSVESAPDLPAIRVNKIRMARALTNLIENAVFSIGNQPGHVVLQAKRDDSHLFIIVSDDGPGIAPEVIKGIWQEGYSTKHSSGLGLPFVKAVVMQHGGRVTIDSDANSTKVMIALPLYEKEEDDDKDSYH